MTSSFSKRFHDEVCTLVFIGQGPFVSLRISRGSTQNRKIVSEVRLNKAKLNDVVRYGTKVADRSKIGKNVQKDHVIAQSKIKLMRTDPTGKVHYNPKNDPAVLAETGKATGGQPAKPHTQKTFLDPQSDVKELPRLRQQGIKSISGDIVEPSRNAAVRSGMKPESVDKALWGQLDELHSSETLAEVNAELRALQRNPQSFRGQRGFATVGGMFFTVVSIAGTVYAISQIRDPHDAIDFAKSSAVGASAFTIGKLVSGSSVVGFVASTLLTMPSDQGEPSEEEKRDMLVHIFLDKHFTQEVLYKGSTPEERSKNYEEFAKQARQLLFHTEPIVVRDPTAPSNGCAYGGQTFGGGPCS